MLVNQIKGKVKHLIINLAKKVEDKKRLNQLRDKYHFEVYDLRKKTKIL